MPHLRVIAGVMDHLMVRLVEWSSASVLFLFGFTLLEPGKTFSSPGYVVIARFLSEAALGWVLCFVAGVRIIALLLDATVPRFGPLSRRVRAAATILCCFAWLFLAIGLYLGNPVSPGSRTYAALLVVDVIIAIYLLRQVEREGRTLFTLRPDH
jgi:hypothetical protein